VELFIICVKFAIYYFLHFNTVRQVAARLRAKSAIYDCLVFVGFSMCTYYLKQINTYVHVFMYACNSKWHSALFWCQNQ